MFLKIGLKNIAKNKVLSIITIFFLSIVISFSCVLNFVYKNINENLISYSIGNGGENKFTITSKESDFISKNIGIEYGLKKDYEKIKNDKNLNNVYGVYKMEIPVLADLSWMSIKFNTDIFVFATDNEILDEIGNENNLKIGLNPNLINLYNTQIASKWLPQINEKILKLIGIQLNFGQNSFNKLSKTTTRYGNVKTVNTDFPILGLTISFNEAQKILDELGEGSLELIKIVGKFNNKQYLKKMSKQYPNNEIVSTEDIKIEIENKMKFLKEIFNILINIIYFMMGSFLISLAINIYNNNIQTIKVLYFHGANFWKQFSIIFQEISIYFIISIIVSFVSIFSFNNLTIPQINTTIKEKGIFNIKINPIDYSDLLLFGFIVFMFLISIFLIVFKNKRKFK